MDGAALEFVETVDGFAEPSIPFVAQPVTCAQDKRDRLRLIRSRRVGPATYRRLLAQHGTARAALAALPDLAASSGVASYQVASEGAIDAEIAAAQRVGARLLCLGDPDYPAALAQIEDAPPALWSLGARSLLERPMVALVGTRNASSLGARMAKRLALDLGAAGIVTVSGLARGIDAVVHGASLEAGTVAVCAGGVDVIYPVENTDLAQKIAQTGLILSEAPMGYRPQARDFPKRNRIISGLSLATVVVEAAPRSGSMITARDALDQGREVLAVPGHPLDGRAAGCNLLLREGARLVTCAADILEALPIAPPTPEMRARPAPAPSPSPPPSPAAADIPNLEAAVLAHIAANRVTEIQLLRDLAADPTEISACLGALEIMGEITREPGGILAPLAQAHAPAI